MNIIRFEKIVYFAYDFEYMIVNRIVGNADHEMDCENATLPLVIANVTRLTANLHYKGFYLPRLDAGLGSCVEVLDCIL